MKMKENRPILKLKLSRKDKILDFLGWLSIFAFVFLVLNNYITFVDALLVESKFLLLFLYVCALAVFLGLSYLSHHPHKLNYVKELNPENAEYFYTKYARILRFVKLLVVLLFLILAQVL